MNKCDEMLKIEDDCLDNNEKIFELILQEYLNIVGDRFKFFCTSSLDKVVGLKSYVYSSEDISLFLELLNKYGYNMKMDIIEAIIKLGELENPNRNKKLIKSLICSPVIDDICLKRSSFDIYSEYGRFSFEVAKNYFRKNRVMSKYIETTELPNRCHDHTDFMSRVFEDNFSITSLCDYYFGSGYYHSYSFDKSSNTIIDLANNLIMEKSLYDNLFNPREISIISNGNIAEENEIVKRKTKQSILRCKLLRIALYKEYLRSINYSGTLEDAPITY